MAKPVAEVPEFAARFEEPERRGISPGALLGLLLLALISGLLAWWFGSEDRSRMQDAPAPSPPSAAARADAESFAPPAADPAQVRRAYDEVRTTYAEGGAPALVDFARQCAETLGTDRRVLDFCVAFDMYAQALAPREGEAAEWFQVAEARRQRLAQEALGPGGDPQARLAEISGLMRTSTAAASDEVAPSPVPAPSHTRVPEAAPVRPPVAKASKPAPAPAQKSTSRCRYEPTPAQRILCANPSLRTAETRMQRAYREALAAGVDRETIDSGQAAFRTARNGASNAREMAQVYARRTVELRRLAEAQ